MPKASFSLAGAVLLLVAGSSGPAAAATEVDLELVLAVDISRSMDMDEAQVQRDGYVGAFRHGEVIEAIRSGLTGRIAVTYVEWSGPSSQVVVAPWTLVEDVASAGAFADTIAKAPLGRWHGTSISGGLLYAAGLFDDSGFSGMRRVIDMSGDGPNNMGGPIAPARDRVVEAGITINGLPIMLKADPWGGYSIDNLDVYYEDCVIGGPGAFLVTVNNVAEFAAAIRRKLVLEIAAPARDPLRPIRAQAKVPRVDCMIGEKLRRNWMP